MNGILFTEKALEGSIVQVGEDSDVEIYRIHMETLKKARDSDVPWVPPGEMWDSENDVDGFPF